MKRLVILCIILLCILSVLSSFALAESILLRYAHVGVTGEPQTRYAEVFEELVEERTKGRIQIDVFPHSQLGNISEMIDGVQTGAISMGHHDFASVGVVVEDLSVFNAPYIYRDSQHALLATNPVTSPVLAELNEELIQKGNMRVLGSFFRGIRQLTANFPVYSPEDLKGQKIRGVPFKLWDSMLRGMGAIPTPVEITELTTGLMTGLVVGQENPLTNIYAQKFYEVQDFVMMTNHMHSVLCVFINEKVWNSIPKKDQTIINAVVLELADTSLEWAEEDERDIKEKLEAEGMTFIEEEDGLDINAFRESVGAQIKKDFPEWAEFIDRIQDIE